MMICRNPNLSNDEIAKILSAEMTRKFDEVIMEELTIRFDEVRKERKEISKPRNTYSDIKKLNKLNSKGRANVNLFANNRR